VIAISLAHALFVRFVDRTGPYYSWRFSQDAIAGLLNVALATLIGVLVARRYRRVSGARQAAVVRTIFVIVALAALAQVAQAVDATRMVKLFNMLAGAIGTAMAVVLGAGVILAAGWAATRGRTSLAHVLAIAMLLLAPFAITHLAESLYRVVALRPAFVFGEPAPLAPPATTPARRRIVLVIMDALDRNLAFDGRPSGLALPELDRLRSQAVFAVDARTPSDATIRSIPGFTIGERVLRAAPRTPNQLRLEIVGRQEPVNWGDARTMFHDAASVGASTAIVGWFHAYCNVFPRLLVSCFSAPNGPHQSTLPGAAWAQWLQLIRFSTPRWPGETVVLTSIYHTQVIEAQRAAVRSALGDPRVSFLFAHLAVPHFPFVYDRRTGQYVVQVQRSPDGYFGNLALMDRVLGEIRSEIAASPLGDSTTLVLTSDHPLSPRHLPDRQGEYRVPVLVSFPGQTTAIDYTAPIDAILLRRLTLELLTGRVASPSDLVTWLNAQSAPGRLAQ
jgi:hypothetical protein